MITAVAGVLLYWIAITRWECCGGPAEGRCTGSRHRYDSAVADGQKAAVMDRDTDMRAQRYAGRRLQ
jgi:hypothetical protein